MKAFIRFSYNKQEFVFIRPDDIIAVCSYRVEEVHANTRITVRVGNEPQIFYVDQTPEEVASAIDAWNQEDEEETKRRLDMYRNTPAA